MCIHYTRFKNRRFLQPLLNYFNFKYLFSLYRCWIWIWLHVHKVYRLVFRGFQITSFESATYHFKIKSSLYVWLASSFSLIKIGRKKSISNLQPTRRFLRILVPYVLPVNTYMGVQGMLKILKFKPSNSTGW